MAHSCLYYGYNDAVKNSFIVYIAFKGFVAAKSNTHYSLKDIAHLIEYS